MFSGLVETLGTITSLRNTGNGIRLTMKPMTPYEQEIGDSIAVNGVCLTVTENQSDISFDVSPETMKSTNLGSLKVGSRVNLERALRLSDRLGGHIVTGHVDGSGSIIKKSTEGEYTFYTFEAPADILRYIVQKGSIAIDGISLTVVEVDKRSFRVAIIPHTLTATIIGDKGVGDKANLEVDIIGKYVEKLLGKEESGSGLMELLKQEGFTND